MPFSLTRKRLIAFQRSYVIYKPWQSVGNKPNSINSVTHQSPHTESQHHHTSRSTSCLIHSKPFHFVVLLVLASVHSPMCTPVQSSNRLFRLLSQVHCCDILWRVHTICCVRHSTHCSCARPSPSNLLASKITCQSINLRVRNLVSIL